MTQKKLTLSIPIEQAEYLEQHSISPSKLLQKAIEQLIAHDIYYIYDKEKVKTYGKRNKNRERSGERSAEQRKNRGTDNN